MHSISFTFQVTASKSAARVACCILVSCSMHARWKFANCATHAAAGKAAYCHSDWLVARFMPRAMRMGVCDYDGATRLQTSLFKSRQSFHLQTGHGLYLSQCCMTCSVAMSSRQIPTSQIQVVSNSTTSFRTCSKSNFKNSYIMIVTILGSKLHHALD